MRRLALCAAAALLAAAPAWTAEGKPGAGPDWPQFRGPQRTGQAKPGMRWTAAGARLLWRTDIGPSFSTVAVRGDRLFTAYSDDESEYLACFDAGTGKEIWRTPVGPVFPSQFGNGPRATPTLDGDVVYLLGGKGRLVAAKQSDGAVVWQVELTERFGSDVPRFGYSGSALVLGDTLMLEVGGKDQAAIAFLDRRTGETNRTALEGGAGYGSPMLATLAGKDQVLLARGRTILGLAADGSILWSHSMEGGVVAMPVPVGPDRVFVSAGDDTGCAMLRVQRDGEGFTVEELWSNRNMRNHFNSSVLVDGTIYGFDNATLKAVDAESGELRWAKRGLGKGSLSAAGDLLAVLTDKGELKIVRATPGGYEELGAVEAIAGKSWTSPSIAGSRVFVRNHEQMACVEVGG